jgi:hypothetical protein
MRVRESVTAVIVALGAASAIATATASFDTDSRGDRLADLRQPAGLERYNVGVTPGTASDAQEIVVRKVDGTVVYVSDPSTATTTVTRGTTVPALDKIAPSRTSLQRAYASLDTGKGDRLMVNR